MIDLRDGPALRLTAEAPRTIMKSFERVRDIHGGDLVSTGMLRPESRAEVAGWPRKTTGKNTSADNYDVALAA